MADRVALVVRVHAPGAAVQVLPPPSARLPSATWMEALAALLHPLGEEPNAFRCCLPGSLAEVLSHLWRHQTLWLRLSPLDGGTARHVAVQCSELLDAASPDLSSRSYTSSVELEEEAQDNNGKVVVNLHAEMVYGDVGLPSEALRPSLPLNFLLQLQASQKSCASIARANRQLSSSGFLQFSCGGVEQPLREVMVHTLVLVSTWSQVPEALSDLDAHVRAPGDGGTFPLDLSKLIEAATNIAEGIATACVLCTGLPMHGEELSFDASVRAVWLTAAGCRPVPPQPHPLPGGASTAAPAANVDPWRGGLATLPRRWRLSLEVRAVKLEVCAANVFVGYCHAPFRQQRPFYTKPPVAASRNATVHLPNAFASYMWVASQDDLLVQLEEPLCLEVRHRDVYEKDSLLGLATLSLGAVFDQPLQHSARFPSMARGFRVLDQECPVINTGLASGVAGIVRSLFFLEDLGPARGQNAGPKPASDGRQLGPAAVSSSCRGGCSAASVIAQTEALALEHGLKVLRDSPAYAAAYELELWRRKEEERFKAYLAEQERMLREKLEEEYRQQELSRVKEFRLRHSAVRDLERKVQRRVEDLQEREATVGVQEERAAAMQNEAKRRADLKSQELEEKSARHATLLEEELRREDDFSRRLEERIGVMESELMTFRNSAKDVEAAVGKLYTQLREESEPAATRLRQEVLEAKLELHGAAAEAEALAASRDHFGRKVEELCRRLLRAETAPAERRPEFEEVQPPRPPSAGPPAGLAAATAAPALHKICEGVAALTMQLNGLPPARSDGPDDPAGLVPLAPQPPRTGPDSDPTLAWLRSERLDLLQSGLYSASDPVIEAIDAKIKARLQPRG